MAPPNEPPSSDLEDLIKDKGEPSAKDDNIVALERTAEGLRDKMNEERFLFIVAILVLIDSHVFSQMPSWGGPIALLVLEIPALILLARRLGVQDLSRLIDRCLESWGSRMKPH